MESISQYRKRLNKLFKTSRLLPSDPPEEVDRIYNELTPRIQNISLFQYRSCSKHSLYALSKNRLILTNPMRFNDPFDTLASFSPEKVRASFAMLTEDVLREYISIARQRDYTSEEITFLGGKESASMLRLFCNVSEQDLEKNFLSKWTSLQKDFLDNTLNEIKRQITWIRKSTRIACLSEDYTSPIMWGHYADSGKGFCVKYRLPIFHNAAFCTHHNRPCKEDQTKVCEQNRRHLSLLPVLYQKDRFDCNHILEERLKLYWCQMLGIEYDTRNYDSLAAFKISCYKSSLWKYEKEWRLILPHVTDLADFYPLQLVSTEAVYLGSEISAEDAEMVIAYTKDLKTKMGKIISIYKMDVDWESKEYKLIAKKLH